MQRFVLLQIQQESMRMKLFGFGNNEKHKELSGDLHLGGAAVMVSLLCACYMVMSVSYRSIAGFSLEACLGLPGNTAEKMAYTYRNNDRSKV